MKNRCPFILTIIIFLNSIASQNLQAQCNDYPELCDKRYDEVVYVTTHNAFNYGPAFLLPNHNFDIPTQLEDGVRAFMLDLYLLDGEVYLYHTFDALGKQLFTDLLKDIRQFMVDNPKEVITFILESYVTAADVQNALMESDLISFVHIQKKEEPWPKLQEMIDNNQRLVILSDTNDGEELGFDWHHYVWDFAVETDWNNKQQSDFSCDFNRGSADNSLFILNHFITDKLAGVGLPDTSQVINSNPYLLNRCLECQEKNDKITNFLTVDFYSLGDVFKTANILNEVGMTSLAVELVHFSIKEKKAASIELQWTTASEYQNNYFIIEHSDNGQSFQSIGKVKGNNFTNHKKNYTFIDDTPAKTSNYYRLKIVDVDGRSMYSKVIHTKLSNIDNSSPSLLIYPNPFQQTTNISLINTSFSENYQLVIYNSLGQKIKVMSNLRSTRLSLNFLNISRGIYYLQLLDDSGKIIDYQKLTHF